MPSGPCGWANKKWCWAALFVLLAGFALSSESALAGVSLDHDFAGAPTQANNNHTVTSPKARLTLRVYNYAQVDSATLANSERVAGTIFASLGIETNWVDCPVSKREIDAQLACDSNMGTTDLVLRILPRRMAVKLRRSNDSLGSAQTCPETEPACELNVFYHRVDELARNGYRADRILGYVIAHETAHVLLGPRHSDDGILRAEWSSSDLQCISLGLQLGFTQDQSRELHLAVVRRTSPPIDRASTAPRNLLAQ